MELFKLIVGLGAVSLVITGVVALLRQKKYEKLHESTISFNLSDEAKDFDDTVSNVRPKSNAAPFANMRQGIYSIFVMADDDQPYRGYELLQALLAEDLRFGDMNIFHRYKQLSGNNNVLFSVAQATEPGTFDISQMGSISCKGLCLFRRLNQGTDDKQAIEIMLITAHELAHSLGGRVIDNNTLNTDAVNTQEVAL